MTQHSLLIESAKLKNGAKETARLAALRATPRSGTIRRRVLAELVKLGEVGATDDELSAALMISPNTIRPRRLELVEGEWAYDSLTTRPSFYGNPAIVWRATPKGVLLCGEHSAS